MSQDLYEARFTVSTDSQSLYVDHRLPSWPEIETVVVLRDEAVRWFHELYDTPPTDYLVSIVRLNTKEEPSTRARSEA